MKAPRPTFELRVLPARGGTFSLELHELDPDGSGGGGLFDDPTSTLLARLGGDPLDHALETVRAWLRELGLRPSVLSGRRREPIVVDEERGVRLALLFAAVAPLERRDRIEALCAGIGRMTREEALYWHGKARHTERNRALKALRILLADETPERRPARRPTEVA